MLVHFQSLGENMITKGYDEGSKLTPFFMAIPPSFIKNPIGAKGQKAQRVGFFFNRRKNMIQTDKRIEICRH